MFFFFFKQKTAYEMRISDWSSDVCSSDLADRRFGPRIAAFPAHLLELHSDYKPVPLDVQVDSLGWHGNAILVRKSAEILQHGILHIPYLEPRGAVSAQVTLNGPPLGLAAPQHGPGRPPSKLPPTGHIRSA